uniref:Uncharacterized protein n=1 Tax=Brassica oleracea TaxID=3712 RepID=A0A3P6EJK6_BRAOL|nr:unnamed protein product [Brassica oleracea]
MMITMFLTRKDPRMVRMRIAIFLITNGNTERRSDTKNEGSGEARESKPTDQQEKEVPMVAHIAEFSQKKEETVELVHLYSFIAVRLIPFTNLECRLLGRFSSIWIWIRTLCLRLRQGTIMV